MKVLALILLLVLVAFLGAQGVSGQQPAAGLWVTSVTPAGGADTPFDKLEIAFSRPVRAGTLTLDKVKLTGPSGAITPKELTRLSDDRYQLDSTGLTGLDNYALAISPAVLDSEGKAMDQNHDGTPGDPVKDAYNARLIGKGAAIAADDTSYDGQNLVIYGGASTIDGTHAFASVEVLGGASLGHPGLGKLDLKITDNLWVDAASKIDASRAGYPENATLGNKTGDRGGSGGSYGGLGFQLSVPPNSIYGDFRNPNEVGSGGAGERGTGGPGGGLVRIIAAQATIDGAILADSAGGISGNYRIGAGGSGGGVLLNVGRLTGKGRIAADGGAGHDMVYYEQGAMGSGGGGRIAVYYEAIGDFDTARITALGGGNKRSPGAVGTVYLKQKDSVGELRIDSHGTPVGNWTPLGQSTDRSLVVERIVLSGDGVVVAPEVDVPIQAQSVSVLNGAVLTHQYVSPDRKRSLRLNISGDLTVDAKSRIDVSGRGYPEGITVGYAFVDTGSGDANAGGSYGGLGWSDLQNPTNPLYGDYRNPNELGSGGGAWRGGGGRGGGLARITAARASINGAILANGANGVGEWGRGGSGGGILLDVGKLTGTGRVAADGGAGQPGAYAEQAPGGSGGGGRIAVYTWDSNEFAKDRITAAGGKSDGRRSGQPGTVHISEEPVFGWSDPEDALFHGVEALEWSGLALDPTRVAAEVVAVGLGRTYTFGSGLAPVGFVLWDTRAVPDGLYEVRASFSDSAGGVVGTAGRMVLVNNAVAWHEGFVAGNETWAADRVHVVERDVRIPAKARVSIEPGAVVKFARGAKITVADGGALEAPATQAKPIVLTSLADDTAGGDTNLDGAASRPGPGNWRGIETIGSGQTALSANVELRYGLMVHRGTLGGSETWLGSFTHHVAADVTVPTGATLTIKPGAVVKFGPLKGIVVQGGGKLDVKGAAADPVIFTSIRDDSVGGDANSDGDKTSPQAGDWRWLKIEGEAILDHANVLYGGGTVSRAWDGTGVLRVDGSLILSNSRIRDAFFDGVLAYGKTTIASTVMTGIDRAISVQPGSTVSVVNSTLDDNRIGVLVHGGTVEVVNTIVTNSTESGIQFDMGTLKGVRYSNIWSPAGSKGLAYRNTPDQTGTNGNSSADPLYRNAEQGDFRLRFRSPAIDAGDGAAAPAADLAGNPRYSDPRTTKKAGTARADGAFADMGAYELVEGATSNIDLMVSRVEGPEKVLAGDQAMVRWTVTNTGSEAAVGPWHDSVALVRDSVTVAGEALVGQGVILGPGQSFSASAKVRVPGGVVGGYRWQVTTNSRGDVFEGQHAENNTASSAAVVNLDLPSLPTDGTPVDGQFSRAGESQWFKFRPRAGQDIVVNLDRAEDSGISELYVGLGYLPSPERFDARSKEWNSARASVVTGNTADAIYYVVAYARSLSSPAKFFVRARTLEYGLEAVSPATAGNGGPVTLRVQGGQLSHKLAFALVGPNGASRPATSVWLADSTMAYVTFDLKGAALGQYALQATRDGGALRSLKDAVAVNTGLGPRLATRVVVPSAVRVGRQFDGYVTYQNTGDSDMPAPLLLLSSGGRVEARLASESTASAADLQFMGASPEGSAGVLRPGQQGRVRFSGVANSAGVIELKVSYVDAAATTPIDWAAVERKVRPQGVDARVWDPRWARFKDQAGQTWGGYVRTLARYTTELAQQGGGAPSARVVLYAALLDTSASTNVSGKLYLQNTDHPLPNTPVVMSTADGSQVAMAFSRADGSFALQAAEGSYTFSVSGYLVDSQNPVTVPSRGKVGPLEVVARPGRVISGFVSIKAEGVSSAGEVTVWASSVAGSFFAQPGPTGAYSIAGLPDGTYTVSAHGEKLDTKVQSGIVVGGDRPAEGVDFALDIAATLSGRVVKASDGAPLAGAVVIAQGPDGPPAAAVTDAQGGYEIPGLSPGAYTVSAGGSGYATATITTSAIGAGSAASVPALSVVRGASIAITLKDATTAQPFQRGMVLLADKDVTRILDFATSDASGRATLKDVAPGTYVLGVLAANKEVIIEAVTVQVGQSITREFALRQALASGDGAKPEQYSKPGDDSTSYLAPSSVVRLRELANIGLDPADEFMSELSRPNWDPTWMADLLNYLMEQYKTPERLPQDTLDAQDLPKPEDCVGTYEAFRHALAAWENKEAIFNRWWQAQHNFQNQTMISIAAFSWDMVELYAKWRSFRDKGSDTELLYGTENVAYLNLIQGMFDFRRNTDKYMATLQNLDWSSPEAAVRTINSAFGNITSLFSASFKLYDAYQALQQLGPDTQLPSGLLKKLGMLSSFIDAGRKAKAHWDAVMNASGVNAEAEYRDAWQTYWKARRAYLDANENCRKPTPTPSATPGPDGPNPPDPDNPTPGAGGRSNAGGSSDPNDMVSSGFGSAGFVAEDTEILYTIHFENVATATAPAAEVKVSGQLDQRLDWSSLQLVSIGFNGVDIPVPPGRNQFQTTATVASDPNPVSLKASLDPKTGMLTWMLASVDRVTGGLPEDPLAGFLPPNDSRQRGEGYMVFSIRPKGGLGTGTQMDGGASIVFDVNAPIATNKVVNTMDVGAPASKVAPLPATSPAQFTVSWSGDDEPKGSGIAWYDVLVSVDGGEFKPWLQGTKDTSALYQGAGGRSYAFYSVATDNVGHREATPASAQASTTVTQGTPALLWLLVAAGALVVAGGVALMVLRRRSAR